MGASNSRPDPVVPHPVVQHLTEGGENDRISYGVSCKNLKKSASAFAAVPNLDNLTSFFGFYDGEDLFRGDEGAEVALLCATQFHNEFRDHPHYEHNLYGAMKMTFCIMDDLLELSDEWKKLLPRAPSGLIRHLFRRTCICAHCWPFTQPTPYIPPQWSGSTACVAVIRGYEITIGNAGHSCCIISRNGQATELATNHKPDHWNEKQRIERAGGRVTKERWSGTPPINGLLTHSRGIGYFEFKDKKTNYAQKMVTCDPEIIVMDITNDVEFLAIVSEGICNNFQTGQGVVDFIHSQLAAGTTNLGTICRRLCEDCWLIANVTAILVQFIGAPPPEPEEDFSADIGNNNDGSLPQASGENLSGGNGNNSDDAPAAALEEQEEHEDYEQPEGREDQPLLADREITEA